MLTLFLLASILFLFSCSFFATFAALAQLNLLPIKANKEVKILKIILLHKPKTK